MFTILRWLDRFLGNAYPDAINRDLIGSIKDANLKTGVAATAVNHMLAFARAIPNTARKQWQWIDYAPKVKLPRTPIRRTRWLVRDQDGAALCPPGP